MFSIEARDGGGARLALNYKHVGRSGIQRISCDLTSTSLLQLVLFEEALSLRNRFGFRIARTCRSMGLRCPMTRRSGRSMSCGRLVTPDKQHACRLKFFTPRWQA